jgi:hypothetical protein
VSISQRRKSRVETPPIVSQSRRPQRRPVGAALLHRHPFREKQQNFRAVDFCIWQQVPPRSRPSRAAQARNPIQRAPSP